MASRLVPQWLGRCILITKRLLLDTGYVRSGRADRIVDAEGRPLPWYTFPAIGYLSSLDLSSARVLEFGSGSSTLYWERRTRAVVAVEHDEEWYQALRSSVDERTTYLLATDEESYVSPRAGSDPFDVIVIDGIHRQRCAQTAVKVRAPGGIIVLDNSDWAPAVARSIRSTGLIQIDFPGFGALLSHTWVTSIFIDGSHPPPVLPDAPLLPPGASKFSHSMRHLVATKPETFGSWL